MHFWTLSEQIIPKLSFQKVPRYSAQRSKRISGIITICALLSILNPIGWSLVSMRLRLRSKQ